MSLFPRTAVKERLLLVLLTAMITLGLGTFGLWRWSDIFASEIRFPEGMVVLNEGETSVALRGGGYRIVLSSSAESFQLVVLSPGEYMPVVTLSGGLEQTDHHATFGRRETDGRWVSIWHSDWDGLPEIEHHWGDEALGLKPRVFDLTVQKAERGAKAGIAEPSKGKGDGQAASVPAE